LEFGRVLFRSDPNRRPPRAIFAWRRSLLPARLCSLFGFISVLDGMGLWINRNRGGDSRRRVGNPALVLLLTDFSFTAQLAVLLHISLQPRSGTQPICDRRAAQTAPRQRPDHFGRDCGP